MAGGRVAAWGSTGPSATARLPPDRRGSLGRQRLGPFRSVGREGPTGMSPLAARLLDHAARVMPPAQRTWVRGMRAELDHIPGPLAAAAFALGCVQASYTQRIRDMLTLARLTRWTVTG